MNKTLTAKILRLERDSGCAIIAGFALMYRGRLLKEFYGVDGVRMTNRIGRWAEDNGFTAIKWVGPAWYIPFA